MTTNYAAYIGVCFVISSNMLCDLVGEEGAEPLTTLFVGVDAVVGKVVVGVHDGVGGKHAVEGKISTGIFPCKGTADADLTVQVVAEIRDMRRLEAKRFHHDDLGTGLLQRFQNLTVIVLISFFGNIDMRRVVAMPCVIDADQDRYKVRLQVQKVTL